MRKVVVAFILFVAYAPKLCVNHAVAMEVDARSLDAAASPTVQRVGTVQLIFPTGNFRPAISSGFNRPMTPKVLPETPVGMWAPLEMLAPYRIIAPPYSRTMAGNLAYTGAHVTEPAVASAYAPAMFRLRQFALERQLARQENKEMPRVHIISDRLFDGGGSLSLTPMPTMTLAALDDIKARAGNSAYLVAGAPRNRFVQRRFEQLQEHGVKVVFVHSVKEARTHFPLPRDNYVVVAGPHAETLYDQIMDCMMQRSESRLRGLRILIGGLFMCCGAWVSLHGFMRIIALLLAAGWILYLCAKARAP